MELSFLYLTESDRIRCANGLLDLFWLSLYLPRMLFSELKASGGTLKEDLGNGRGFDDELTATPSIFRPYCQQGTSKNLN
jgi:hypothetical protein